MPARRGIDPRIGDDAVAKSTGKSWKEWFSILDGTASKKKDHKQIVAYLAENHPELNQWWQQMVTVTYEQARGRRDLHEKPVGYEISVSRTIKVDMDKLFRAWKDKRSRRRWLENDITIRTSTPNKSMRLTWEEDGSSISLNFYEKGESKIQIVVQHQKLPNAKAAQARKTFWAERLDSLRDILTSRS